ncbi:hypothetical protein F5ESL0230_02470 [Lactobacillus sp. ESL0230]|nr:hypothetical protein F5ESL0230_02470 [Lactobacillus sp. ESL0230]
MEIGELLKKYRLMHAATKKAWAKNVLSPSFYARVEKGLIRWHNRISKLVFLCACGKRTEPHLRR